jgi:hypothetical protein
MTDPWASVPDPWASPTVPPAAPAPEETDDLLLGTVAGIVAEKSDLHLLAVLLDARLVVEEHGWDWNAYHFSATLLVPPHALPLFTDERQALVREALDQARVLEKHELSDLYVRPLVEPASATWREDLAKRLEGGRPVNQARVGRTRIAASEDGLDFRSLQELAVYRELKRASTKPPQEDSLGIVPGAGFRATTGNVWEPDFLVTYHGRVAAIEVDGPAHTGRAANDHSRDRLIQRSGVAFVERIAVADVDNPVELARFVSGFLRRLSRP